MYRNDSIDTSVDAAHSIDTSYLEKLVLDVIFEFGPDGCISDQVRDKLPELTYGSVTARYRPLINKGMVKDTGERRPGNSGRQQRVMRATDWDLIL